MSLKKYFAMPIEKRHEYMCGGRVTVGYVDQVLNRCLKRYYVAKVRGIVVGNEGEYLHETPELARAYGNEVLAKWRKEIRILSNPQSQER